MTAKIVSKYKWEISLLVMFVLMMTVFVRMSSAFDSFTTILNVAPAFLPIAIMSLGTTGVILSGGIDLSIGGIGSLTAVTFSVVWLHERNLWIAILVGLLLSAACGYLNGLIVTRTRVQPLIATLATMFIFQSLAIVVLGQQSVSTFPNWFLNLGNGNVSVIPEQFILFLALALIVGFMWSRTSYGHHVRLLGNNEKVAQYSGVQVERVKRITYLLSGLFAGISGIVMVAYFSSVMGDLANANLLVAVAGCVLGGINIFGGSGGIIGVVLGSLFLGYLGQGLNFMNVSQSEQSVVTGLILIIAVSLQRLGSGGRRKISGSVRSPKTGPDAGEEAMPTRERDGQRAE